MKVQWPWKRPHGTQFVSGDTRRCQACWECVRNCPRGVLGKVDFLWHRHVRVDRADACTGCRKCIQSCKHGALISVA